MFGLQEIFESTLEDMSQKGDFEHLTDDAMESMSTDVILGLAAEIADSMLVSLKKDAESGLGSHKQDRKDFETRLYGRWKHPLDLLDLAIAVNTEAGDEFNQKFQNDAVDSGDAEFEALSRLHARACQVSSEVLALLHAGFADGAHARWRSLHEMAAVASIIHEHGQELAERYLLHETVQQYKLAVEYQKSWGRLGVEPPSQEDLDTLKARHDELITRFGKRFKEEYGWASSVIRKGGSPTMRDIEQHVHLDHLRPYYRMASDNVHPNSHGAYFRLGLHPAREETVLLAGPSIFGLADPGHSTAISLGQITANLLATESDLDCIVILKVIEALTHGVGEAFLKVHQELEAMAASDA